MTDTTAVGIDTSTKRILRLIEMDAVPAYVVRELLRERDELRHELALRTARCGQLLQELSKYRPILLQEVSR